MNTKGSAVGLLYLLVVIAMLILTMYFVWRFITAWQEENLVDMVGFGFLVTFFTMSGMERARS